MKGNIFIKRPVMAISISVLILAIGLISLFTLPVEQYPDIAPPTVYVAASYTGADAEAVMNSVIMPLEESINGVEDMMYITSSASNAGLAIIQVYFKQGTDPDMAAVNVQNRVAKAQGLLPAEVTKVGVSTMKRQTSFLQIGAMVCTDGRYDQTFLANYLDINVIPQIKRIEGVGDVMELGDIYSMRIWLKPERMAQYGLVPSDITGVLGEQNIEAPTGSLGESSQNVFQFTMKYRGRLKSVEEFQNTVVLKIISVGILQCIRILFAHQKREGIQCALAHGLRQGAFDAALLDAGVHDLARVIRQGKVAVGLHEQQSHHGKAGSPVAGQLLENFTHFRFLPSILLVAPHFPLPQPPEVHRSGRTAAPAALPGCGR